MIGENHLSDIGQIICAFIFFGVRILDTFFFRFSTFLNKYLLLAVRIPFGVMLMVISGYLARTGLSVVFGEEREKPSVIKKGVFGIVRHPIYFSEVLLYLGFLILSLSLAAAVVWVFAIIFLYYISRYEEILLLSHFGDEYKKYMNEVPMWIPKIRKRKVKL
ncbi:MAG: isoprenylcysteine carboxylmethyltransferase family protein [candidate division WOR-3 bacterium]